MRAVWRAYGRTIAVDGAARWLKALGEQLPPGYRTADPALAGEPDQVWRLRTSKRFLVAENAGGLISSSPLGYTDYTLRALQSAIELWVAEHASRFVFVHAGCVVVDGRAIVIPGRSMAGKTSLTAALVRAGATYYSDEYAVLDSTGRVRPYPRALQIRPYDGGATVRTPVADIGGSAGRGPRPVGLIAALRYDATAGWDAARISPGAATLALIDNAVAARSRPRAVLGALAAAADAAAAVGGTRGDADEAAENLANLIADQASAARP